jgi:lysophospholipase L1-like esterase
LALLCVGILEFGLRCVGWGDNYQLVVPVAGRPEVLTFQLNPQVDSVYFGSRGMLGPEPRRFDIPKPAGTRRIVVLGASTVNGFPYATEIAFPRQLEVLLEAQEPHIDVEVLNAGITAINSFEIADLAPQCAACEPDLVIVHSGHNEFFGPGGPGSSVLPLPPRLVELTFTVRRTRLGQLVGRCLPGDSGPQLHPLQEFPRLTNIQITDPEFAAATENYRGNLRRAVQSLRSAGIPVLLTTVACNLKDQAPIRPLWPDGFSGELQSQAETAIAAANEHVRRHQGHAAVQLLEGLPATLRDSALWQYRYAQALEAAGDSAGALRAYTLARDYDGCRFRAPGEFGEIVRSLAKELGESEIALLDLEELVQAGAAGAAPGHDWFLEHVHYNLPGHRRLARLLARKVCETTLGAAWNVDRELNDAQMDARLGLLPEDDLAAASFALEAVKTPPLSDAVDSQEVVTFLTRRIGQAYEDLPFDRREAFAQLTMHELQHDLAGSLSRQHAKRNRPEVCLSIAHTVCIRRPWESTAWLLCAQAQLFSDDIQGAKESLAVAQRLDPDSAAVEELAELLGNNGPVSED